MNRLNIYLICFFGLIFHFSTGIFDMRKIVLIMRGTIVVVVVGFMTTYAVSAYYHYSCEFESRSLPVVLDTTLCDKVCQYLRQVSGFLWVLRFPPPIKLTARI